MYWIVIGDIHNETNLVHGIKELDEAKGILISGDLTIAGGVHDAQKVLNELRVVKKPLLAQCGNMDKPVITNWLKDNGLNLHGECSVLPGGLECIGLGYSTPTPFKTPGEFSEEQFEEWLKAAYEKLSESAMATGHWVLVSHTPPYDTRCDKLVNGTSVGSRAVRRFIEKYQPAVCFCGHIHESVGQDVIGCTMVLNPGMLADGGYGVLYDEGKDELRHIRGELRFVEVL